MTTGSDWMGYFCIVCASFVDWGRSIYFFGCVIGVFPPRTDLRMGKLKSNRHDKDDGGGDPYHE
jgi:hypothetical protein